VVRPSSFGQHAGSRTDFSRSFPSRVSLFPSGKRLFPRTVPQMLERTSPPRSEVSFSLRMFFSQRPSSLSQFFLLGLQKGKRTPPSSLSKSSRFSMAAWLTPDPSMVVFYAEDGRGLRRRSPVLDTNRLVFFFSAQYVDLPKALLGPFFSLHTGPLLVNYGPFLRSSLPKGRRLTHSLLAVSLFSGGLPPFTGWLRGVC